MRHKKCYVPEYKVITKERTFKEKETLPQQYTKIIISKSAMMIALLQTPYEYAGKYDKEKTTKTTNCTIRRKVQNNGRAGNS